MIQPDPEPVDEIDPEPPDDIDPDPDDKGQEFSSHPFLNRIAQKIEARLAEMQETLHSGTVEQAGPTDEIEDIIEDEVIDEEIANLNICLKDSPASLDAWLQVCRLMSSLEESFTWLSEIEGGLRSKPVSVVRIRRALRRLTTTLDAVAYAVPSIAVQLAASMTSGSSADYQQYVSRWWSGLQTRHKMTRVRFRP